VSYLTNNRNLNDVHVQGEDFYTVYTSFRVGQQWPAASNSEVKVEIISWLLCC